MVDDDNFTEGIHFYCENGLIVFTENYHLQRGYCCGNGCRHCPYNYEKVSDEKMKELLKQKRNAAQQINK